MENNRDQLFEEDLNMEDQPETERDYEADDEYAEYEDEEGYVDEEEYSEEEYEEYEDEEEFGDEEEDTEEAEEEAEEDDEEEDDTKYVYQLLEYLEEALVSGTSVPLTNKRIVDIDKCFDIIRNIKENLPDGIQFGLKIHAERDRILERAENIATTKVTTANVKAKTVKDEADEYAKNTVGKAKNDAKNIVHEAEEKARAIVENASNKAKKMISESEIMQRARTEAGVLLENARVDAHERRLKAVNDAYRLLDALEKQTAGITEAIARRKNEMIGNGNR